MYDDFYAPMTIARGHYVLPMSVCHIFFARLYESIEHGGKICVLQTQFFSSLSLACKAEARHKYCSSIVVIVIVVGGGGVNFCRVFAFCINIIFSRTIRARAMKLGPCIQHEE